jgi:hypothetical protein
MPQTVLGYMGYCAVAMHMFGFSVICDGLLEFYFKIHIYVYSVFVYLMLLTVLCLFSFYNVVTFRTVLYFSVVLSVSFPF